MMHLSTELTPASVYFAASNRQTERDLQKILESAGHPVVRCYSAAELFLTIDRDRPGCILLDLRMPDMDGLEIQRELRRRGIELPVIFFSRDADVPTVVRAFKQGAVDFLQDPCPDAVLVDSVDNALEQSRAHHARIAARSALATQLANLSQRERAVTRLVLAGYSSRAIGEQLDLSQKTVEAHRASVMRKLEAHSLPELVRKIISIEYEKGGSVGGDALLPPQN